ncbi:recombinase family protein [Paenibacillus physcomitrellae]|uniref:Resolvase/invertase-type recombinase catalytic domain-containing protein n=1 Tax=Paenibacillus physcomitrellae TaxID=1619311 RepID=A0ABQ1G1H2_9BACL|nr:recombinase family protein [Paenibacillus physcomitrellae]GGA34573.1 hypothetical protein GCM10010917_19830 [Paenibacillus physcomitrellae]
MAIKRNELEQREIDDDPEGYAERQLAEILGERVASKKEELFTINNQFHRMINLLIEKDTFRAERVLRNLNKLTINVEFLDFFCSLFDYNYTYLTTDERTELIDYIGGYLMNRVAVYVRVSTEEQADEGYSIEGQLQMAKEYCDNKGLNIVGRYQDEGISGKDIKGRHDMQRLLGRV